MRHRFAALPVALLALLLTVDGRRRGVPRHDPAPERLAPRGHHRRPRQHRLRRPARERRHRQGQRLDRRGRRRVRRPGRQAHRRHRLRLPLEPHLGRRRRLPRGAGVQLPDRGSAPDLRVHLGFINDVAVTRDAVYATDSNMQQLLVIPLGRADSPGASVAFARPITGDFDYLPGFNANGIENLRQLADRPAVEHRRPVRDQRPHRVSRELLPAGSVPNADGLERKGSTLFVVRIRTTWSTSTGSRSAA